MAITICPLEEVELANSFSVVVVTWVKSEMGNPMVEGLSRISASSGCSTTRDSGGSDARTESAPWCGDREIGRKTEVILRESRNLDIATFYVGMMEIGWRIFLTDKAFTGGPQVTLTEVNISLGRQRALEFSKQPTETFMREILLKVCQTDKENSATVTNFHYKLLIESFKFCTLNSGQWRTRRTI